jgi:ATP-dependent Clp protease protease subunit
MTLKRKFWNFTNDTLENTERTLYIIGTICDDGESWYEDDVTPKLFKSELNSGTGNVTLYLDSQGGDTFCAAEIYNALMEYSGKITVKIGAICASAASVIAMAGDEVLMSPTSILMIHNPATVAVGDSEEMTKAAAMLDSVKQSIINAYERKTNLSRRELSKLMDEEKFMDANEAIKLGFADGILYAKSDNLSEQDPVAAIFNKLPDISKIQQYLSTPTITDDVQLITNNSTTISELQLRLAAISH